MCSSQQTVSYPSFRHCQSISILKLNRFKKNDEIVRRTSGTHIELVLAERTHDRQLEYSDSQVSDVYLNTSNSKRV